MFQKIKNHLAKHIHVYLKVGILLGILTIVLLIPDITYAGDTGKASFEQTIARSVSYILKLISMFIWLILGFIGMLLNNDFIVGKGMEVILHQIWLVMRNLVNVGFVIVLLGAAFYMVLFPSGEKGVDIKNKLPTFLLAMVLVNFSWLGCRVILDVSTVLTTAVFAIPQSIDIQHAKCSMSLPLKDNNGKVIQTPIKNTNCFSVNEVVLNPDADVNVNISASGETDVSTFYAEKDTTGGHADQAGKRRYKIHWSNALEIYLQELPSPGAFNQNNAVTIMALNLASIQNMPLVAAKVKDISHLTITTIFSLILIIIVIIPLIVLFIVLVGRMVVLWLTIAFMPLVFLGWVISGSFTGPIFEGVPDIFKQFIDAAFLPVYVAAPIAVGFLMINAGIAIQPYMSEPQALKDSGIMVVKFANSLAGLDDVRQVLWHIATAGVLWASIGIASSKGPEFTKSTVDLIGNKSKEWGTWLAKAPIQYAPIMPVYTGHGKDGMETFSLGSLFQLPDILQGRLEHKLGSKPARELAAKILGEPLPVEIPKRTEDKWNSLYKKKETGAGQDEFTRQMKSMKGMSSYKGKEADIKQYLQTISNANKDLHMGELSGAQISELIKKSDRPLWDRMERDNVKWDDVAWKTPTARTTKKTDDKPTENAAPTTITAGTAITDKSTITANLAKVKTKFSNLKLTITDAQTNTISKNEGYYDAMTKASNKAGLQKILDAITAGNTAGS